MIRGLWLGLLFLLFCVRVCAIDAVVSHTVFYMPDTVKLNNSVPYSETYWQLNPRSLHYIRTAEKMLYARIKTDIVFTSNAGIVHEDHYILETTPRTSESDVLAHSIIELRRYVLTTGFIRMKLVLTDITDSTNRFAFTDSFMVAPATDSTFYSGIELLDTAYASNAQTDFQKNGQQQIPLCSNFIDDNRKIIHYYTELYGSNHISKSAYPLTQRIFISRRKNEAPYERFMKTETINPAQVLPSSGSFSVATLLSGNYYLNATIENREHRIIASSDIFFQLLNTHPAPEDSALLAKEDSAKENITVLNLNKTFIGKYSLSQVRSILKMLLPVCDPSASDAIKGFLKNPDETYMRYFIYNYFVGINKENPDKAWKEYSDRVREVNKLFNSGTTAGYETDRGFIYLRYDKPDEQIRVENETGSLPYEIWQYNTLHLLNGKTATNAVFLFYRPNETTSDLVLLHSTVLGEVQNKSWRSYLYTGGNGSNNSSSMAEQYLGNK